MKETNNWLTSNPCALTSTGTSISGLSGTSINSGTDGIYLSGNSTINTFSTLTYQNMRPQQVKVAVFTITRDEDTNEINSTKFVKELWIERKNGTSIDLIVAKQLDVDFDPETTVIKEITSISF
jgi:hypothetical protein